MRKNTLFFIAIFAFTGFVTAHGQSPVKITGMLMPDSSLLRSVQGKITGPDTRGFWYFQPDTNKSLTPSDSADSISLRLLPSRTLEKIEHDFENYRQRPYRLSARVTTYKGKNFLFPIHFLPLGKESTESKTDPNAPADPNNNETEKPPVELNSPEDILTVPQEIIDRRSSDRPIRRQQQAESIKEKNDPNQSDSLLIDRTGFIIIEQGKDPIFQLDGLGRNIEQSRFVLLPCRALELAEYVDKADPEHLRFRVTGIVTQYKGQTYLLLQRAIRAFNHGNLGR